MTDAAPDPDPTVDEVLEYCTTQAGILAGRVDLLGDEASRLVDDLDAGVGDLKTRLDAQQADSEEGSADAATGATDDDSLDDLLAEESTLRQTQQELEVTRARMEAFQSLATAYLELAESIEADAATEDGGVDADDAISRVLSFEAEHDAPTYFEHRETLLDVARGSDDDTE